MTDFNYRAKSKVLAAQWTGSNLEEMRELLQDVVDKDADGIPHVYAEYIEPYFISSLGKREGYYILQTEFDEFDPGVWIIVHENGDLESMDNEDFEFLFEKG